MALSGTTAIVGAACNDDACPCDPFCESGSAYLYDFSDPCSIIEIKLTASDAAFQDNFGSSALSGGTALVGARWDDDAGTDSGSAYLFDVAGACPFAPVGDINLDCRVDLTDFALVAGNWLVDCILNPSDPACQVP